MKWISVKDKLPEEGQWVLCYSPGYDLFTAQYSRYKVYYEPVYHDKWDHGFCCGREPENPTYWMLLPQPPKYK